MARLIDVDEAKRRIVEFGAGCHPEVLTVETIVKILDKTPTVDAVPVVHGKWKEEQKNLLWCGDDVEVYTVCSVCESYSPGESNYCPNCGAKMDGGNDDEKL